MIGMPEFCPMGGPYMPRVIPTSVIRIARMIALAFIAQAMVGPLDAQDAPDVRVVAADQIPAVTHDAPTFYADVLPILHENCVSCHQPAGLNMGGNVAPFSLMTYEDARPRARRIASAVKEGRMPPWSAAEWQHGMFKGDRYLEDDEKTTLIAWAEEGASAGDPQDAPPLPEAVLAASIGENDWFLGEPDLVLEFDEPFCMDDDVRDIYVNIPVQLTEDMLPEDRWIQSIEYRNGPAVHHIVGGVGGLVPGAKPRIYEEGYGRLLRSGPREIMFNMHYNKEPGPGTGVCSNIKAGITFKKDGDVIHHVTGGDQLWMNPASLLIPAGDPSYSQSIEYEFEEDVEILSFMPHMHLRGKAALYEITYPDGRHETLLHVPKYEFNWQHSYAFKEPVLAPKGSVLRFTLWWDNSEDNPNNPDPSIDVRWGRPTHAEMSQGYMSFQTLDERHIVVGEPLPEDLRVRR